MNNSTGMRLRSTNMNAQDNAKGGYKPRRQYDENFKRHAVDLTLQGNCQGPPQMQPVWATPNAATAKDSFVIGLRLV